MPIPPTQQARWGQGLLRAALDGLFDRLPSRHSLHVPEPGAPRAGAYFLINMGG